MTEHNLPGRTERETHQYLLDRGHRLAAAMAFHYHARRIETDDTYLLPAFSEAVIAAAGADMQDVNTARLARSQAYAAERHAILLAELAADRAARETAA